MSVPADQREAFLQDRSGALIGARLVDLFGWKVGQNVTLRGTIYPGDWTFTVRGVYTPTDPVINDDAMMFHWRVPGRAHRARQGIAGWYIMQIDGRRTGPASRRRSTTMFRNSSAPTKTGTEQAFNASFATMWGNVGLLMNTIGMAVVFAILLVAANAMMMSARERTRELAVLKTIGFSDRRLFGLVMLEAGAHHAHRRRARPGRGQDALQGHQLQRGRLPAGLRRDRRDPRARRRHRAGADARERDRAGACGRRGCRSCTALRRVE